MTAEQLIAEARANLSMPRVPTIGGIEQQLRKVLRSLLLGNDYDGNPEAPASYLCRHLAAILAAIEDLHQQSRH